MRPAQYAPYLNCAPSVLAFTLEPPDSNKWFYKWPALKSVHACRVAYYTHLYGWDAMTSIYIQQCIASYYICITYIILMLHGEGILNIQKYCIVYFQLFHFNASTASLHSIYFKTYHPTSENFTSNLRLQSRVGWKGTKVFDFLVI
jgi:hypothetical protein